MIECITLIYGVLRFSLLYIKEQDTDKHLLELLNKSKPTVGTTFLVIIIVYPPILLIPPILYKKWFEHDVKPEKISHYYTVTAFLTHIFNGAIRAAMIFVTVLVRVAWTSYPEDRKPATCNSETLLSDYDRNRKTVSSLQNIFQPWFVLQWIIYFIAITEDCMAIIGALTINDPGTSRTQQNQELAETITILMYNISAFAVPYICGTVMNYYYREYHKVLQDRQRQLLFDDGKNDSENDSENDEENEGKNDVKFAVNWILDKPDHQFVPTLCCLNIPLNNVGHTLTILLSLLAPMISLVNS